MKRLFILIFLILYSVISIKAQNVSNIELLKERITKYDKYQYMSGNGGIRIVSPRNDLMIEVKTGNGIGDIISPELYSDELFEYIIPINISNSPEVKISVTLKGKSYSCNFIERHLKPNTLIGWFVRLPEIVINEGGGIELWPNANEAIIEIKSILKLNIDAPSFYMIDSSIDPVDPSKNKYNVHIPIKYLNKRDEYLTEIDSIDHKIKLLEKDENIDPIELYQTLDYLGEEKSKLESEIESLTSLSISSGNSNLLNISIMDVENKQVKKFGVDPIDIKDKRKPKPYLPNLNVYCGLGINPLLQLSPSINLGIDYKHWNFWSTISHSLSQSEGYIYNSDNNLLGINEYNILKISVHAGWEWEPWADNIPLFGITPNIGIAWDHVYSNKEINGNGYDGLNFMIGSRIALKTNNRHYSFFVSPAINFNLYSNPKNNYEIITEEIKELKSTFELQIGAIYYF